jgi:hypothetical protein
MACTSSLSNAVQMTGQTPSDAAKVNRAVRCKLMAIASVQESHHQLHGLSLPHAPCDNNGPLFSFMACAPPWARIQLVRVTLF